MVEHLIGDRWFNSVTIIILIIGTVEGWKRGFSVELLNLIRWGLIAVVSALYYEEVSGGLLDYISIDIVILNIISYLLIGLFIWVLISLIKKIIGEKPVSAEVFGWTENPLGAMAGLVKAFLIILVCFAIINPITFNSNGTQHNGDKPQNKMYSGMEIIKEQVLKKSVIGGIVSERLAFLMITKPVKPLNKKIEKLTPKDRLEKELNEVIEKK